MQQNQWSDRIIRTISYIGQGFPTLITGLLLLFFAQLTSPLFPVGGMTSIEHEDLTPFGKVLRHRLAHGVYPLSPSALPVLLVSNALCGANC